MDIHELDFRLGYLFDDVRRVKRQLEEVINKCDEQQARIDKLEKNPVVFPIIIDPSAQGCDRGPLNWDAAEGE